ncbi:MAG TPA: HRDC domain-containing protein, partial [Candidatus Competibacteraceae bacterium]|nr:HRDC domain-containing protein [Candidatus Competibacteraceae bacterium]
PPEIFANVLEKLWIHGGARVDPEDNVIRGGSGWQESYQAQCEHKLMQLEQITRFAQAHECRMLHLVRHFGDQEDSGEPCGVCDSCTPRECVVRAFRRPTAPEARWLLAMLDALRQRDGLAGGQLQREIGDPGLDRRTFNRLLGGLSRAGLVEVREASFSKQGRVISYRRVFLTAAGRQGGAEAIDRIELPASVTLQSGVPPQALQGPKDKRQPPTVTLPPSPALLDGLRSWRLEEARKRQVPAFTILHDRVLAAIATARPRTEAELLTVTGIGPTLARKYGQQILAVLRCNG